MQQFNFIIFKFLLFLVSGILFEYYWNVPIHISIEICIISVVFLTIIYFTNKNRSKKSVLFGWAAFSTFFCIGILTTSINNQKNHINHYTKYLIEDINSPLNITFKVKEILKPGMFYDKYVVDFKTINRKKVTGKLLLNIKKDSIQKKLKTDEIVHVNTKINELIPPLNPNQFNYKEYLKKKNIYHQIFAKGSELYVINNNKSSVFGFASILRETINKKLKKYKFKTDELAIINALILGQRQDISKEIYDSYAQAGAIHILAVSGLHVGIILFILNFLLKPLEPFKYGTTSKIVLMVLFLWCFAIIAGLSASVTRAVTMFSIVAIGINLKRPTNIYNTLAISMFILLIIKPMFLFDVGFQMSYLAVFSIVWIQPLLYKIWKPKYWLANKFWQIFTVTLAAQLGVAPISLFYFHQFPGLFFISNLAIIPFLGFILGFGILIIVLALLNCLPQILASAYGYAISLMNDVVSFVSNQEEFLFKNISFGILCVISSYLLIIALVKLFERQNYSRIMLVLSAMAIFISVLIFNNYMQLSNEFIVFHKSRYSLIGIKQNDNLKLYHNLDSLTYANDKVITNYKVGNSIQSIENNNINSVHKIKDKLILIVDSLGVYRTSFKPDYVLLRNSPKINLNRLIDELNPELIIADGSNYKTYQERWLETCTKKELPFYQTSKKGAFIIKYE